MDGKDLALLTPEDADHDDHAVADSGEYFVDSYSKPDVPPGRRAARRDGKLIMTLEKADISQLAATGWKPPMPITVKARDGKTDLYGLMYKPTTLDPTKKYPIVNHIYPGPADRQRRQPHVLGGARRRAGARRARLRRRRDRRHGHAVALEEVPRRVLRQHGRQHAAGSGRRR